MQQIISKGCVKIKEVFSDLFKLRNAVNLKKNPLGKKWKFLGGRGSPQMTLWKGNSKGVGGKDIFWNHTLYGSIRKEKWGQMRPDNAENTLDYAEISTIKAFPMYQTIQ